VDLNTFFDGFSIVFVPALVCFLAGGIIAVSWAFASFVDWIIEGFRMGAMLRDMKPYVVSDEATKEYVIQMRTRHDAARLARLKRKRDEAMQALKVDLPDGLPANMKYLDKEETGEVDVTAEILDKERNYLICTDPLGATPKYFFGILKGRATERGVRDCRFHFTPIRSRGRRMTKREYEALLPHLPRGGRDLFIVEDKSNVILDAKAGVGKIVEKLVDSGITLDELQEVLPLRSEQATTNLVQEVL
jgi:hypothetical protein